MWKCSPHMGRSESRSVTLAMRPAQAVLGVLVFAGGKGLAERPVNLANLGVHYVVEDLLKNRVEN
jgi:hypothetical protein